MEDKETYEPIVVEPQGIPYSFAMLVIILVLILAGGGGYAVAEKTPSSTCTASQAMQKAQLDSQTAQLKMIEQQQQSNFKLQSEVATKCSEYGAVPVITGGNVFCEPMLKGKTK